MAAPPPSNFDGNQVLQHSFEESTGRIRVDATLSPGGPTEVIISHLDDSIRLGDGTNFLSSTTVGGKIGLDVSIINDSIDINGVNAPTILNVSAAVKNTEYSFTIPSSAKTVKFKARGLGKIQYSFTSGTTNINYFTIEKGSYELFENLDLSANRTVYFETDTNTETIEVRIWS